MTIPVGYCGGGGGGKMWHVGKKDGLQLRGFYVQFLSKSVQTFLLIDSNLGLFRIVWNNDVRAVFESYLKQQFPSDYH
jgi:hypothetical protein